MKTPDLPANAVAYGFSKDEELIIVVPREKETTEDAIARVSKDHPGVKFETVRASPEDAHREQQKEKEKTGHTEETTKITFAKTAVATDAVPSPETDHAFQQRRDQAILKPSW